MVNVMPDDALKMLMDGNDRFTSSRCLHPRQDAERMRAVLLGQKPFAVILACSDSRIPPEIIFDQGIGDVFVVRVAGHVLDHAVIGSIEYAVDHLHVPLVFVLGHSGCGAVQSTIGGGEAAGNVAHLIAAIRPAWERAQTLTGDILENTVKCNVEHVVQELNELPGLKPFVMDGRVKIVGAHYELESGVVTVIA